MPTVPRFGRRYFYVGDNAKVTVPCLRRGDCDLRVSQLLLLSRGITFYGRLGFLPVPDGLDHEDAPAYARAICGAHEEAGRANVGQLRRFLGKLLLSAASRGVRHEQRFRVAGVDYALRVRRDVALARWRDEGAPNARSALLALKGIADGAPLVGAVASAAADVAGAPHVDALIEVLCMGHASAYWAKRVTRVFNTLVSTATRKTVAEWPFGAAFATMLTCTNATFELALGPPGAAPARLGSFCDV